MPSVGYGTLDIIPSFKGIQGKIEQGTASAFVSAGRSSGDKMAGGMRSSIASHAKSILGPLAVGFAAFKIKDFLGDSIAEARESQKVGALSERVIKSTGSAAKVTAKEVGDLATAISNRTGIDDEAIQSGENMLLTFKNLRNETGKGNKIFTQSAKITTDMAAAMAGGKGGDIDLKSSSILVGKALNDPVKGLTALSRVGVTFTAGQKDQIKSMVESGKLMDAQKVILKELNSEFGGAAEAQATLGEKSAVAWGNIKEGMGTALLPLVDDVENAFLHKGVPAAQKFVSWFEDKGVPAIQDFTDATAPLVKSALPAIGTGFGTVRDTLKDIAPLVKTAFDAFNALPKWAQTGVILGAGAFTLNKKLGSGNGMGGKGTGLVGNVLGSVKPIPVIVMNEGFGKPGVGDGKPGKRLPPIAWFGPALVPAVGGAAAGAVTPVKDRNQMAPGSAGFAGDGGMTLPAGALDFSDDAKKSAKGLDVLTASARSATSGARNLMLEIFGIKPPLEGVGVLARHAGDDTAYMNKMFGFIPPEKATKITTPGLIEALNNADRFKGTLDNLPHRKDISIITSYYEKHVNDGQNPLLFQPGKHRATGGPVSANERYWVGENGPELFEPPTSGRIRTTADSARLARGGSGGSSAPRRVEMTITNWRTGEGYMREIAGDTVDDSGDYASTMGRMRR